MKFLHGCVLICVAFLSVLVSAESLPVNQEAARCDLNSTKEIFYTDSRGKLVVFNLDLLIYSYVDISYLDRRDCLYPDLGGSLSVCSSDLYHCVFGKIAVVIPKEIKEPSWAFNDISCSLVSNNEIKSEKDVFEVECRYELQKVRVFYSKAHGISEFYYSSSPASRYILRGGKGLLSDT